MSDAAAWGEDFKTLALSVSGPSESTWREANHVDGRSSARRVLPDAMAHHRQPLVDPCPLRRAFLREIAMDTTTPITTHERRIHNDRRAMSIYRRRRDIDRVQDEMKLRRQLKEPCDE